MFIVLIVQTLAPVTVCLCKHVDGADRTAERWLMSKHPVGLQGPLTASDPVSLDMELAVVTLLAASASCWTERGRPTNVSSDIFFPAMPHNTHSLALTLGMIHFLNTFYVVECHKRLKQILL